MRLKMTLLILSLSAAFATPVLANYFFNPYTNLGYNIGSAPSPTPREVREQRLPRLVHPGPPYADVMPAGSKKPAAKTADGGLSSAENAAKNLSADRPSR